METLLANACSIIGRPEILSDDGEEDAAEAGELGMLAQLGIYKHTNKPHRSDVECRAPCCDVISFDNRCAPTLQCPLDDIDTDIRVSPLTYMKKSASGLITRAAMRQFPDMKEAGAMTAYVQSIEGDALNEPVILDVNMLIHNQIPDSKLRR